MSLAAADQPAEQEAKPRASRRRQVIQVVLSVALVVAVFVGVLPQVADFGEVFNEIGEMTSLELASLLVIALWNLATYWFVWMICLPGLKVSQAALVTEASTAVANTVPAGSAVAIGLSYTMFASWGFRRSIITLALLVSGIWNNFAKLALPVVALVLLALQGQVTGARIVSGALGILALAAAVVVFALVLRSEEMARRVGIRAQKAAAPFFRLLRRPEQEGWDEAVARFRNRTVDLLGRKWMSLTLATLVSHLSLYLVLLVALRHVGVSETDVSWVEVLAAFAFTRLVSAIPITPGGVGVIELAMTAALVTAGGDREQVVAAVLVYRGLTYLLPIPIGLLCYLYWRSRSLPSLS